MIVRDAVLEGFTLGMAMLWEPDELKGKWVEEIGDGRARMKV
jgi:hypothetical protein